MGLVILYWTNTTVKKSSMIKTGTFKTALKSLCLNSVAYVAQCNIAHYWLMRMLSTVVQHHHAYYNPVSYTLNHNFSHTLASTIADTATHNMTVLVHWPDLPKVLKSFHNVLLFQQTTVINYHHLSITALVMRITFETNLVLCLMLTELMNVTWNQR